MRKLVTIRKISEIKPIEGADRIELAKIDGWQCVVRKGEFNVGELGVYFEIDSFIPIKGIYEFLRKSCYKKMQDGSEGFRLRTAKFKKQLSQGLLLPISTFPDDVFPDEVKEGEEVTERLEVKLYQPPVPAQLSGTVKGVFPGYISKSDQERIQNLPEYFTDYKNIEFEESEKIDGSSCTMFFNEGEFGVCSRNLELKEDETNTLWRIARKLKMKTLLENVSKNVAIQGEMVGEGIQKNSLKLKGQQFYIYDIYDIDNKRYMTPDERGEFIELMKTKDASPDIDGKLKHVSITNNKIKIFETQDTMEKLIEYAKGKTVINKETNKEVVIFKSHTLHGGNTISFKVINNDYLLKSD